MKNKGSVTVEACVVLPLFLFCFLAMVQYAMLFFVEAHIYQSLAEATVETAESCYPESLLRERGDSAEEDRDKETGRHTTDVVGGDSALGLWDAALLKKRFDDYLGDDMFVEKLVVGKKAGIVVTTKRDSANAKRFYANAAYGIKIPIPVFGNKYRYVTHTVKQKAMVGYEKGEEEMDSYVYVTPNREVYHCSRSCTHLTLSVSEVGWERRMDYQPCSFCAKRRREFGTSVYVARTTNVYHYDRNCSGLKRTVNRVRKSSVEGLPPCERCGG